MYSHLCALAGFITPGSTIVRTISPGAGTFYSPGSVSDILTRSHKHVTGEREEDKMPGSQTRPTKEGKRPLRRSRSHTITSTLLIMHTHTLSCMHMVIFKATYYLYINMYTPATRPAGPVRAGNWIFFILTCSKAALLLEGRQNINLHSRNT